MASFAMASGLSITIKAAKKKQSSLLAAKRSAEKRKERGRAKRKFLQDPYKTTKSLFTTKTSGKLEMAKDE